MTAFVSGFFYYLVIFTTFWVITFFMALPIGIKQETAPLEGHDPGAPANPNLKKKAGYSALVAAVLSVIAYYCLQTVL